MPNAADMTTDQLAAYIHQTAHANPDLADALRPSAIGFVRQMTERLPGIPTADLAAVLINVACWLTDAAGICREAGGDAQTAVNVVALVAEQLHRKARREGETR
jgi:hypothetical protein